MRKTIAASLLSMFLCGISGSSFAAATPPAADQTVVKKQPALGPAVAPSKPPVAAPAAPALPSKKQANAAPASKPSVPPARQCLPVPALGAIDQLIMWFADLFSANFGLYLGLLAATGYTTLAVYPVTAFMRRGWFTKKADIFSSFSENAKYLYLKTFLNEDFPAEGAKAAATARFEKFYEDRYGRYRFIFPIGLFATGLFVAMFLLSEAAISWISLGANCTATPIGGLAEALPMLIIPQVAAAGVSGAYIWIVAEMISRSKKLDLNPSHVLQGTLRLATSAAVAVAFTELVTPVLALPIAFAVGAFPLETVRTMLRRVASDKLGLGVGIEEQSTDQILNLDSIDHLTADRLLNADISTIAQLAYADPVQLCMRTGLGFDFVVDIVSQALAWIYFGDRLNDLRPAGLRGAMEVHCFLSQLASSDESERALAEALLDVVVYLPGSAAAPPTKGVLAKAQFLNTCDQIANDPYTIFLGEVWRDGVPGSRAETPDYVKVLGKGQVQQPVAPLQPVPPVPPIPPAKPDEPVKRGDM